MKKAVSRTGNKGFTLLEVLVAVAVLGVGLTIIFPSFLQTAGHLRYLTDRQEAGLILDGVLADAQSHFRSESNLNTWLTTGDRMKGKRMFRYRTKAHALNNAGTLYEMTASVRWEGRKGGGVQKSIYLIS